MSFLTCDWIIPIRDVVFVEATESLPARRLWVPELWIQVHLEAEPPVYTRDTVHSYFAHAWFELHRFLFYASQIYGIDSPRRVWNRLGLTFNPSGHVERSGVFYNTSFVCLDTVSTFLLKWRRFHISNIQNAIIFMFTLDPLKAFLLSEKGIRLQAPTYVTLTLYWYAIVHWYFP